MRCPKCGYITEYEFESCPMCMTHTDSDTSINPAARDKGGFWIRLLAFIVDNIIIFFAPAFFPYIGYFVSFFLLGLGFVMIAFDRNKRGFHDFIAGTCVIRVE